MSNFQISNSYKNHVSGFRSRHVVVGVDFFPFLSIPMAKTKREQMIELKSKNINKLLKQKKKITKGKPILEKQVERNPNKCWGFVF